MSNSAKNVNVSGVGFPKRLNALREAKRLSKSDLADKAGLSYRTIHDLESGKRRRVQEKTLLLLAEALDVPVEELLAEPEAAGAPDSPDSPDAARPSRRIPRWLVAGSALLIVLALAGGYLWHRSGVNADWDLDQGRLVVRDEILGTKLWEISGNEQMVTSCLVSPWDSRHLLVGTSHAAPEGGRLLCLERASGDTVWAVEPDIPAVVRAFGPEHVMSARFTCQRPQVADLDGDGLPEVIAPFVHGKYFPHAICVVNDDGLLRAQYANKGHVYDIEVVDLDGDGKDEILAAGTTNNDAYRGATLFVLDDRHFNGASVDSQCNPSSGEPDSALVRVVLPNFPEPYMGLMQIMQISAGHWQVFKDVDGKTQLSVVVSCGDPLDKITVFLDAELRPLRAEADDSFLQHEIAQWPDSLKTGTGPGDPAWLAEWFAGHLRFEVGRPSPHPRTTGDLDNLGS